MGLLLEVTEAQDNMGPMWLQEDVTGHWLTFPIIGRLQFPRLQILEVYQLQMMHLDFVHFYDMFVSISSSMELFYWYFTVWHARDASTSTGAPSWTSSHIVEA
uniref:Uncharacterized protein n=1 Tax=Oryza glaberrima TaxID=4538 RepID=I1R4M6_ORYGL